jgi:hypothetical protein
MVSFFLAYLNITDMEQLLSSMKAGKEAILSAYLERSNLSKGQLSNYMKNETWFSAEDAVKYGFADEIIHPKKKDGSVEVQAQTAAIINMLNPIRNHYVNIPDQLIQPIETDIENQNQLETSKNAEIENLRRQCKIIK